MGEVIGGGDDSNNLMKIQLFETFVIHVNIVKDVLSSLLLLPRL